MTCELFESKDTACCVPTDDDKRGADFHICPISAIMIDRGGSTRRSTPTGNIHNSGLFFC